MHDLKHDRSSLSAFVIDQLHLANMCPESSNAPGNELPSTTEELAQSTQPKTPPLAFEPTSNDSLLPPVSSLCSQPRLGARSDSNDEMKSCVDRLGLHDDDARRLQVIVDQQTSLVSKLHETFADERRVWGLERERLHQRVARLEALLKRHGGHSPAKSPIMSPLPGYDMASPQTRPAIKLSSIAEDEHMPPLTRRRMGAPCAIDLSGTSYGRTVSSSNVSFAEQTPTNVKTQEVSIPSPDATTAGSPWPLNYRMEAGHTPVRASRPRTPTPPQEACTDGTDDTPTRNNTQINTLLTLTNAEDEEKALKGPLNMPELPHMPEASNFTLHALGKRLEQMEGDAEARRPLVFKQKSPGLASPAAGSSTFSSHSADWYASHHHFTSSCFSFV